MPPERVDLVDVGGVALCIRRWSGAEPPFVLVHGLSSNALTWERVADALAAAGHAVVSLDQRGHGQSDKPGGPYDMAAMVADLHGLLGVLRLDRIVLAGQSWGGNVALEYGWRHPDRVEGLICVDGGTIDLQSAWPRWEDCWEALAPPPIAGLDAGQVEGWIRDAHPAWDDDAIAATMANLETLPDRTVRPWLTRDRHEQVLHGLWEHRPGARYRELRVPVLLVPAEDGDADERWAGKAEQVEAAEAAIPRVRVRWFRSAHDIHVEQPEALAEAMRDALAWFAG